LNSPWDVAVASDGSLYIADLNNNRVRRVASGSISTVAGNGTEGFGGDGGSATAAQINGPASVAFDPAGNLYIADSANNRVRKVYAVSYTHLDVYKRQAYSAAPAGTWQPANPQDAALKGKWWEMFHELELNALEEQLNINNQNIAQYFQNFMAARALVREARASYYPTLTTDPSYSRQRTPGTLRSTGAVSYTHLSRPFILRPVATALLMAAMFLAGGVAYFQLPVSALPEVDYPTIQVQTLSLIHI